MDTKERKKEKQKKDIELPSVEDQIKDWCEASVQTDDTKSADDLVIDAWCGDPSINDRNNGKRKKENR
ncbi:MAG: hypothetical protein JW705_02395 [Methanosarcinaceae archaeon]|nr:hypothetical protein [Methanosarcinaceae archaeon]